MLPSATSAMPCRRGTWEERLLQAIRFLLSGVCHQLPTHSYWAGGRPLPLCARCSGTFLGVWAGLLALRLMGRHRRTGMPSGPAAWVLGSLAGFWALDGANSFLVSTLGRALYPPSNLLRLISGAGMGVALSALIAPMMALAFGTSEDAPPAVRSMRDANALLAAGGVVTVTARFNGWLPYAAWVVALGAAVLGAVGLLNAVLVRLVTPRLRPWGNWFLGVLLALGEMGAVASLRGLLGV